MNEIRLYLHELESIPEYSTTIPTGTVLWKMWRSKIWRDGRRTDEWSVSQYVPPVERWSNGMEYIRIRTFRVVLRQGPAPPIYRAPDWGNYERYKKVGYG